MSVRFSKTAALIAQIAVICCATTACDDTTAPPLTVAGPMDPGPLDPGPGEPEPAPSTRAPSTSAPSPNPPHLMAAATPSIAAPVMVDPNTNAAPCFASPERCNAIDDDCDGGIDEGLRNACGDCGPAAVEQCDGIDDDCDGAIDEGLRNACGDCGPAAIEQCDGVDDDCDGVIDEDAIGVGVDCATGLGACRQTGLRSCDDGALRCAVPAVVEPEVERCDAIDNDCDGDTDEALGLGDTCAVGRGACAATGVLICDARTAGVICAADPGPAAPEVCDGEDNDCDGVTDEQTVIADACMSVLGAVCQRQGAMVCAADGPACGAPVPTAGECAQARPTTVDANDRFACAINMDAQVKCWGDVRFLGGAGLVGDDRNELGGRLQPIDLAMPADSIAVGGDFGCALSADNRLKCWGQNAAGQLGQGDRRARGADFKDMANALRSVDLDMRPVQVVAGAEFACALDDVGQVKCWGDNVMGSLGQGDVSGRGGQPDEMGRALPAVDLGDFAPIKLAAGDAHVCGLDALGTVKCWGANDHLQLAVIGRDNHRGDDADEMGAQLPDIRLRANIVDIAAGPHHTCAVSDMGAVNCWGAGYGFAPIGLNLRDHAAVKVSAGAQTCILSDAGATVCWGLIDGVAQIDDPTLPGTLHRVALPRPTVELATSAAMNCAVDVDGDLRCWGRNEVGQLGQGDVRDRTAADVMDLFPVSLDDEQL